MQVISRVFRNIQRNWCIFSHTNRRATTGERRGLPCSFWKPKNVSWFWKDPDCVHPWVEFSIQNLALSASWRKNPKSFPEGYLFLVFLIKCLSKCPISTNSPHPLTCKNPGCAPAPRHYSFCKTLHLKCLTVFWISLCLDNCSNLYSDLMLCTVSGKGYQRSL